MFKFVKFIFCLPISVFLLLFCRKFWAMKNLVLKIIFPLMVFPAFSEKTKEDKEAFQEAIQKFKSFVQSTSLLSSPYLLRNELKTLFFDPGYVSEQNFSVISRKMKTDSTRRSSNFYGLRNFVDFYENSDELTKLDIQRVFLINIILMGEVEHNIIRMSETERNKMGSFKLRRNVFFPAMAVYLEDLELFQTTLGYNLLDGNQKYKKKLLEVAFQWKKDKTVKWFIEKYPLLVANEKEDFFNLMLQKSDLEGMKWITGLMEIELMPEYLERAVNGKKWEIADWLVKKKPQLLSQINFEELFDIMLNQKNMAGIKWIIGSIKTEVQPRHLEKAISDQSWEIADWLIMENLHLLEQVNFTELFDTMLNQKSLERLQWITKLAEIEVRPNHVRKAISDQSWEIADWLIMENLHLLEQVNFTELFDTMLNQKKLEGINWIAGLTKIEIRPGHLKKAIASRSLEIADWLVKRNPQIINQLDFTELFNEMLSQNNLEGVKWITGLELVELEAIPGHLKKAIASRSLEIADWLVKRNPQIINQLDFTELFNEMLNQNSLEGMKWLVELKPKLEPKYLKKAIASRSLEIADWLVKRNSQIIHRIDLTEIFETAMESEHIETAEWLFKNGFVLSEKHFDKAFSKGKEKFAEWLLEHIDHRQNTQNQKGQMDREQEIQSNEETSLAKLMQAIENRDIQTAKQLSKAVDLNEVHQGHTALTKSIETQEYKLIKFFMNDYRINIDTPAGGDLTASMWAVIKGDLKTLEDLGKKGADFNMKDNKNRMLLDMAEELKNPDVKRRIFQTIKKFLCKNLFSSSHWWYRLQEGCSVFKGWTQDKGSQFCPLWG